MSPDFYAENNAWWTSQLDSLSAFMARATGSSVTFRIHRSACESVFGYYRENFFLPGSRLQPNGWLVDLIEKLKELGYQPELNVASACTAGIGHGSHMFGEVFVRLKDKGKGDNYDTRFARVYFLKGPEDLRFLSIIGRAWVFLLTLAALFSLYGWITLKMFEGLKAVIS